MPSSYGCFVLKELICEENMELYLGCRKHSINVRYCFFVFFCFFPPLGLGRITHTYPSLELLFFLNYCPVPSIFFMAKFCEWIFTFSSLDSPFTPLNPTFSVNFISIVFHQRNWVVLNFGNYIEDSRHP